MEAASARPPPSEELVPLEVGSPTPRRLASPSRNRWTRRDRRSRRGLSEATSNGGTGSVGGGVADPAVALSEDSRRGLSATSIGGTDSVGGGVADPAEIGLALTEPVGEAGPRVPSRPQRGHLQRRDWFRWRWGRRPRGDWRRPHGTGGRGGTEGPVAASARPPPTGPRCPGGQRACFPAFPFKTRTPPRGWAGAGAGPWASAVPSPGCPARLRCTCSPRGWRGRTR
jgi:hypothetical protein